MKAIRYHRFGNPAEVLTLDEVPTPLPGPAQVRVRMIASPINPSDLLSIRGQYGTLPKLPASPGFEGVGVVEASGGGLLGRFRVGRRVAVLNGHGGNWQEQVIVPARQVVPIPSTIADEQAAGFFVNPASAYLMVRSVLQVPAGAWLLQTAAGSALGKMVIALGKRDGFRTINVVRRREQAEELLRLGGDAAICSSDESIEQRVRVLTNGEGVRFAMDAVGGETGSAAVRSLAQGGRLVVYGTLSNEPLAIDPRTLIGSGCRVEGFWLSNWIRTQRPLTMLRLFRQIKQLMAEGVFTTPIAGSFPLDEIANAVKMAESAGRDGKVLLRMT